MEAKFGNSRIDVFYVQELRVMYRKAITLYCTYLRCFTCACKYIYGMGLLRY